MTDVKIGELREALLEQLAYLGEEVKVLQRVIGRVPEPVLEGRPLEADRSIKELFGSFAARDERLHLPFVEQVVAEDEPRQEPVDDEVLLGEVDWNDREMPAVLEEVRSARAALVDALGQVPEEEWERGGYRGAEHLTLLELAHAITQEDAAVLRTVSYRLHESNLSAGPQGPPK